MEQTQVTEPRSHTPEPSDNPGAPPTDADAHQGVGGRFPVRSPAPDTTPEAAAEAMTEIRRFCLSEPGAGASLGRPDNRWLPAALYPYRNQQAVRQDYPLFLAIGARGSATCRSIVDLLFGAVESFAPEADAAKTLKDNLARLEVELRAQFDDRGSEPINASEVLATACDTLEHSLALKGPSATQLHDELASLRAAIPGGGVFLPMSERASLQIYLYAVKAEAARRAESLRMLVTTLRSQLRDLLATERSRGEQGRDESTLAASVGSSDTAHFDPAALSKVLGSVNQGEVSGTDRIERLDRTIETLDAYLADPGRAVVQIVSREAAPECATTDEVCWSVTTSDPCGEAGGVFDKLASDRVGLVAALRTARLELDRAYVPARHDALVLSLDWRSFSKPELLCLPPVLALESPDYLAGADMLSLSRLLLSGRPVDVMVNVAAADDPGASDADRLGRYRLELAYLGIGHREALVSQTTAARPVHLLDGIIRGLGATHASLHVIASGLTASGDEPALGAWLHGGAALEGRAHPLFHYNPEAGDTWVRRLDFSMNPSAEDDWPTCEIQYLDAGGAQASITSCFTFADFALLEEAYRDEFRLIPEGVGCDTLVEAAEYLGFDAATAAEKVPFVWAADSEGRLCRLAFTRRLAFTCRDRLGYWHTLQELSGVRNEYVIEAVQKERERLTTEFDAERERLAADHAEAVEQVRSQAAGEALRRLAEGLVNADIASLASSAVAGPGATSAAALAPATSNAASVAPAPPVTDTPPTEAEPAEEDDDDFDEPWIDTALCTTCNDCMAINAQVFVYNANKQAVIADATAGTFAEIVAAAEKCPARCIHPAKPLNPNETGLDDLIERAKPFN